MPAKVNNVTENSSTKLTCRRVRPRKVSDHSVRKLLRTLRDMQIRNVHITVKKVVEKSGLSLEIASRRTISCYPNEEGHTCSYFKREKRGC